MNQILLFERIIFPADQNLLSGKIIIRADQILSFERIKLAHTWFLSKKNSLLVFKILK